MGSDYYPTVIAGIKLLDYATETSRVVQQPRFDSLTGQPCEPFSKWQDMVVFLGQEYVWDDSFDLDKDLKARIGLSFREIPTAIVGLMLPTTELDGGYTYCRVVGLRNLDYLLETAKAKFHELFSAVNLPDPDVQLWFGVYHSY